MAKRWRFEGNDRVIRAGGVTLRGVLNTVVQNVEENDSSAVIHLSQGDPSAFPSFLTTSIAEDAVCAALRSAQFNGYSSTAGIPAARSAVANYLSKDLPYKLSGDDVFLTVGCTQALEAILTVVARPGANILLPRPGYPDYEARAYFSGVQVRHYDLLPDKQWEMDLDSVDSLADENTVAMVVINPGNPCGNVFNYQHLKMAAETAKKLGILVISDEVYGHLTFESNSFVSMGVFASIAPVVTLGSISKRWMVPGWRLGWLALNDPDSILANYRITESIKGFLDISSDPATFMQGAIPEILENTPSDFFDKVVSMLRESAEICYKLVEEIPCLTCPNKPQGCMFLMMKLNLWMLEGIEDDLDFCCKLAKEESVILLPGIGLGLKNWVRVTFAVEASYIYDAFRRIRAFCRRHAKKLATNIVMYN